MLSISDILTHEPFQELEDRLDVLALIFVDFIEIVLDGDCDFIKQDLLDSAEGWLDTWSGDHEIKYCPGCKKYLSDDRYLYDTYDCDDCDQCLDEKAEHEQYLKDIEWAYNHDRI
tara:strand:+ start:4116 stop:4460 length:345 start_codon:yes stop_codon:yes gene_type:complete